MTIRGDYNVLNFVCNENDFHFSLKFSPLQIRCVMFYDDAVIRLAFLIGVRFNGGQVKDSCNIHII